MLFTIHRWVLASILAIGVEAVSLFSQESQEQHESLRKQVPRTQISIQRRKGKSWALGLTEQSLLHSFYKEAKPSPLTCLFLMNFRQLRPTLKKSKDGKTISSQTYPHGWTLFYKWTRELEEILWTLNHRGKNYCLWAVSDWRIHVPGLASILLVIELSWWLLRSLLGAFPGNTISTSLILVRSSTPSRSTYSSWGGTHLWKKFWSPLSCLELLHCDNPDFCTHVLTSGFNYTSAATL